MLAVIKHPLVKSSLLLLALLTAVFMFIAAYYWYPVYDLHKHVMLKIKHEKSALSAKQLKQRYVKAYNASIKKTVLIESKLNTQVSQSYLKSKLNTAAQANKVKIISESYSEGRQQDDFIPLLLEFSIQGDYPSIKRFLAAIVKLDTWSEVVEARIKRSKNGNREVRATLELITYRKKPEKS